jgi:hypothetical protein
VELLKLAGKIDVVRIDIHVFHVFVLNRLGLVAGGLMALVDGGRLAFFVFPSSGPKGSGYEKANRVLTCV